MSKSFQSFRRSVTLLFHLERRLIPQNFRNTLWKNNLPWPVIQCHQSSKCMWTFSVNRHILLRQDRDKIAFQSIWIFSCRTLCQMFHNWIKTCGYLKYSLFHLSTKFKTVLSPIHASFCYKIMLAENIHIYLSHSTFKTCSLPESQCSCITSKVVPVKVRFRLEL